MQACGNLELFEKHTAIPNSAWGSDFKPEFEFEIKDTNQVYQILVVLRHTEKYRYNNIFLNLGIQGPGDDSVHVVRRELQLANNEQWLGEGMNDIYEHRIPVGMLGDTKVLKAGTYRFQLAQIMREDPLEHVLDVGLRVEKK